MLILIAIVFISVLIKTLIISSFVQLNILFSWQGGLPQFAINIYEVEKVQEDCLAPETFTQSLINGCLPALIKYSSVCQK